MKTLFFALFKKEWIFIKRYCFNYISGIFMMIVIFLLILFGVKGFAGNALYQGNSIDNLILGYIMWLLTLLIYQDFAITLHDEAKEGILEQLYMSPYGYNKISVLRLFSSLFFMICYIIVVLLGISIITGIKLKFNLLDIFPIFILLIMPIVGVSWILGGIQLLFKRMSAFIQLFQIFFVGFVSIPYSDLTFLKFLPGTQAAHLIREMINNGKHISQLNLSDILIAILIGIFYLLVGRIVFKICERKAMILGKLGHY